MSSTEKPKLYCVWRCDKANALTGNVLLAPVNRLCVEPEDYKQTETKRGGNNG